MTLFCSSFIGGAYSSFFSDACVFVHEHSLRPATFIAVLARALKEKRCVYWWIHQVAPPVLLDITKLHQT